MKKKHDQKLHDYFNGGLHNLFNNQKKQTETFETNKKLAKLKFLIIIVKKGHGIGLNDILYNNGSPMNIITYGEGTKNKYVMDILGGEESSKEVLFAIVNENIYPKIRSDVEKRFGVSNAAKGVLLSFDISSLAGVFAYKYLSDYEGALKYGKESK